MKLNFSDLELSCEVDQIDVSVDSCIGSVFAGQ